MNNNLESLEKIINSGLTTSIKKSEIKFNQLFIDIDFQDIISTILFLKTNDKSKFKQLIDITAVDYPHEDKRFKVVYLLLSHENNFRVIVNTFIKENETVPSITKIFPSANWMEREIFDVYGVIFKDHPDLR